MEQICFLASKKQNRCVCRKQIKTGFNNQVTYNNYLIMKGITTLDKYPVNRTVKDDSHVVQEETDTHNFKCFF